MFLRNIVLVFVIFFLVFFLVRKGLIGLVGFLKVGLFLFIIICVINEIVILFSLCFKNVLFNVFCI